jgi:hypothetical protein
MVNRLFELGRQYILAGTVNMTTDTIAASLLDLNTVDVGIKAITGATVATPIAITATAHGFSNGDLVFIDGVGGNLAANGLWTISGVAANTFNLTDYISGANSTGLGTYTSGGYAVCYGPSTAADFYDDFDAAVVGATPKVTLTTKTFASGVFDALDTTFPSVTGASVEGIIIFKDTGTNSTSNILAIITGKHLVTANATLSAGTVLAVEPVTYGIPNGTVLTFSTGQTATVNATVNAGDRTITVLATTVTAGGRALAPATGSGLPVTPNGGNIVITWDNGANRIFKL